MILTDEQQKVYTWLNRGGIIQIHPDKRLFIETTQLSEETILFFLKYKLIAMKEKPAGDAPGSAVLSERGKAFWEMIAPALEPSRQRKVCPYCGEEILEVASKCKHCHEFLDSAPRPAAVAVPRASDDMLPEQVVWEGNPSYLYYFIFGALGILFIPAFGLGLLLFIYAFVDRHMRVFTHTTRKVAATGGVLSRKIGQIALGDVGSVNMSQNPIEKFFNLGTISIGSAGTSGIDLKFVGIENPARVRDAIERAKSKMA